MMTLLTFLIVVITVLVFLVYERIEWLTGAMESHSDKLLKIEALRGVGEESIKLTWWDPTLGDPTPSPEHNQEITMDQIFFMLPPHLRDSQPKWQNRFQRLWRQAKYGPGG